MRVPRWATGTVAAIAALGLVVGASRSGEPVELDTVSDVLGARFGAFAPTTSSFVFDESKVRTYEFEVAPDDWDWLNANQVLEQYVPASLTYAGRTYPQAAIRYKGYYGALRFCFDAAGNLRCDKLSFKVKFNEYQASGRFYGLQRLNLHGMNADATKMRDALAYGLFRAAGVPAPRVAYARVVVNGELLGLFAVVEDIDEEFVRQAFPDAGKGTLYKEVWPAYADAVLYEAKVVVGPADQAEAMSRFAGALRAASDDDFVDVLRSWTDYDTFVRYLAVDRLIDNWDGIVAWYCPPGAACFNHNYFWYEEAFADRVWLIPWDMDHVFEHPSPIRSYYRMPDWDAPPNCTLLRVFRGIPARPPSCDTFLARLAALAWDDYAAASRRLLEGSFRVEALHARIDRLAVIIAEAVAEDPNGPTVAEWEAAVAKLKDDVVSTRAYIEAKVAD